MIFLPIALLLLLVTYIFQYYRKNRGLPPGPARLPFIGNIHQLPEQNPWRTYQQWSMRYGPIFSLRVGLDTIVMLNNHETAHDLLDDGAISTAPVLVSLWAENVSAKDFAHC